MTGRPSPDGALTAERGERKYLVAPERAPALARAIGARLEPHRFTGAGANRLPGAHHYVTTIYFDSDGRDIYRSSIGSEVSVRLRAREYYDLHPSLREGATDARQLVRYQPVLWLEVKTRDRDQSRKLRAALPKPDAAAFLSDRRMSDGILAVQRQDGGDPAGVLEVIDARFGPLGVVRADCLVNYRRLAWQDPSSSLRVTLDVQIAFYAPPADLWTRDFALVRETLGPPRGVEPSCVVEVKWRGEPPSGIDEMITAAGGRAARYSKFEVASRAVHGDAT
jgi:hypothetical protein